LQHEILGAGKNNLYTRLLNLNAVNFKDLVKARWNYLKDNQLSKSIVAGRIEAYRKILGSSNAFLREKAIWLLVEPDINAEATYMTNWYSAQYNMFNSYVNGL
jgi:hypothetical protein